MWVYGELEKAAPTPGSRHSHIYLRRVEAGLLTTEVEVSLLKGSSLEYEGMLQG